MKNTDVKKEIGKRIKIIRKSKGMTQEFMSEKLDISIKHLSDVERGVKGFSIERLIEISELLGVDMDYLICGKVIENTSIPAKWCELYLLCPKEKRELYIRIAEETLKLC